MPQGHHVYQYLMTTGTVVFDLSSRKTYRKTSHKRPRRLLKPWPHAAGVYYMATGVRNNTGILILVFSIYMYLVCNFVVSHFPTIYNNVPMGDIVAGTDNPALRQETGVYSRSGV